jgi:hypothetical protein
MSRRVAVTREVAPMPQPQPLVSVIIPTRNRARLLRRSIASVLGQSWRNLEVIVVDDGSTDDTAAALAACADPRLHVLRREQGSSAAAARNAGIAAARGDYLAFNDDDDIWLPHKLEYQMGALLAAGAGYGLCLCSRVLMQQTHARLVSGAQLAPELDFSRGNGRGGPDYSLIATPSWVVRREALERAGHFDERLITWEEWPPTSWWSTYRCTYRTRSRGGTCTFSNDRRSMPCTSSKPSMARCGRTTRKCAPVIGMWSGSHCPCMIRGRRVGRSCGRLFVSTHGRFARSPFSHSHSCPRHSPRE